MDKEYRITNESDESDPTGLADAPGSAEEHPARSLGSRLVPVGARAMALAGFASMLCWDAAPTRTVSVSFH